MSQDDRGIEDLQETPSKTNRVAPWSCAKAEFSVQAPGRSGKQRRKQLQEMKGVAFEGLNSTPYVKIHWTHGGEEIALFDTGAQWSLICEDLLSQEEKDGMQTS